MDYSKSEHANCLKIYGKLDIKWHATLAFTKKNSKSDYDCLCSDYITNDQKSSTQFVGNPHSSKNKDIYGPINIKNQNWI
jgi:hypothetical protein